MTKEFDVHLLLTFSDFFGSIEANTHEEAMEVVTQYLKQPAGLGVVRRYILENLETGDFETKFTDVLEVGVDI